MIETADHGRRLPDFAVIVFSLRCNREPRSAAGRYAECQNGHQSVLPLHLYPQIRQGCEYFQRYRPTNERFRAKWTPLRVKKTKNLELWF
ncbi:hypothetical protein MTX26_11270 [Bradyrhizobium sp. ISRA443]|uniref:hypothetical protein n=1 Tax=unclassified Bradyrhizobium TaxID=2631580 RepID=UPI002479AAA1|nr:MULTISPECIES: hypothetical protein [unclassified Bradyrhizobium]WGS01353.1 hypothetical protein MTX23_11265 [Bradyrhizobium sp. ISRA436]WGS08240.1 hypothetical protein MTX18_11270 [Bradyrhizobium sp. ISRA437]WGS15128.1 hypothetical protein MTX26_11270 [Bradyrhizobium sp. ISRA443]